MHLYSETRTTWGEMCDDVSITIRANQDCHEDNFVTRMNDCSAKYARSTSTVRCTAYRRNDLTLRVIKEELYRYLAMGGRGESYG